MYVCEDQHRSSRNAMSDIQPYKLSRNRTNRRRYFHYIHFGITLRISSKQPYASKSSISISAPWINQRIRIWVWKWLLPVSSNNQLVNFRLTHSGSLGINKQYISYPIGLDFLIIYPRRTNKLIRTVLTPRLVTVPYNSHRFSEIFPSQNSSLLSRVRISTSISTRNIHLR